MGTNYYLRFKPCEHCGLSKPERHIGKSSGGWHFGLRVYPDEGILDLPDWEKILNTEQGDINDEYGRYVSRKEMLGIIRDRRSPRKCDWTKDVYESNHAEPRLNNLVRHRAGKGSCISNGAGTWDNIVGEFS